MSATDDDSHDLELTPMDHNNVHHSLPLPEDMVVQSSGSLKQHPGRRSRRFRYLMYGAVALFGVAVAVIGLTLGLKTTKPKTQQQSSESGGSAEFTTDGSTTFTPPVAGTTESVVDWLVTRDVATRTLLTTAGTPQSMAVQWLAEEDTMDLPTATSSSDINVYLYTARYALTTFYYALQGPDLWSQKLGFLQPGVSVCDWSALSTGVDDNANEIVPEWGGVFCNDDTKEIYAIDIELNGLQGSFPTEIGLLTTLRALDLEYNAISGKLPDEFCKLTHLNHFWIQKNQLTGSFPDCFAESLPDMLSLNVLDNVLLSGDLHNFCSMPKLESVVADRCSFEGPLPPCSNWSNMQILSLADNSFTGIVPTEWTNAMPSLRELYLDGNKLQGNPLGVINTLTSLDLLYIEENFFTGALDATFATNLVVLRAMDLSENEFTLSGGTLPTQFLAMPELSIVDLSKNELVGSIPDTLAVQNNLFFFSVHENAMTGTIPSSLMNLKSIHHFDVSNNKMVGTIPDGLFDHPPLYYVLLAENPGLTPGPIPNMTQSIQLREVSLKNTNRYGPLPDLVGYKDLFLLDLDDNDLTGTIPSSYGSLPYLRHLLLNSNVGLTGVLPVFTSAAANLGTVLLDKTSVTGDFNSICDLPTFQGITPISTEHIIIADCADEQASGITCDCCHCCTKDQVACSDPLVASLDWTWEYGFAREARDFAINATRLQRPKRTP